MGAHQHPGITDRKHRPRSDSRAVTAQTPPGAPSFLVIGAQKCGTTTLCELLGEHPEVYVAPEKEPHFFSLDENYARGWSHYLQNFAEAGDRRVVGEGSTSYTMHPLRPDAAARVADRLPGARLVYIVRHPIERIESTYLHLRFTGREAGDDFMGALERHPQMVATSRYWDQIGRYRARFPDEQILVVFFDDLVADARSVLARCFEFLGVDSTFEPADSGSARNVSLGRDADTSVGHALRRLPGAARVFASLPPSLAGWIRRLLKRPLEERPEWDPAVRRRVVDALRPDMARFLAHYGKPLDYWDLDGA